MLRIGLTQRVEDREGGERRDQLDQAWTPWLAALGMRAVPIPSRTPDVAGYVRDLRLDGVILSGGNDLAELPDAASAAPERDACEHALLELSARSGLPLLGICRGLQIMARHHGARLERVEGHVATLHPLQLVDAGPLRLRDRESVNSFHRWGIRADSLPSGLCVAATAPDGGVEAIYHAHQRQAALMWHPERGGPDPRDAALLRAFFGSVP